LWSLEAGRLDYTILTYRRLATLARDNCGFAGLRIDRNGEMLVEPDSPVTAENEGERLSIENS